MSESFVCSRGLRQGENLSPILFSLYLNDLENYLESRNSECISLFSLDLDMYLKLFVLHYADDTVIFAKSEYGLVSTLSKFVDYCESWKLQIYVNKTKIMIFGDRVRRQRNIIIQSMQFEVVDSF